MPNRSVCFFGALGALLLFACGEQGDPQAPQPAMPGFSTGATPRLDAGSVASAPDAGGLVPVVGVGTGFGDIFPSTSLGPSSGSTIIPGGLVSVSAFTPTRFLPVQQAQRPVPAISGGTLAAASGLAVASDPDRDRIYLVDLASDRVDTLELAMSEEPGRVVIHGARAFVALRGAGALLTVDLRQRRAGARLSVCAAPRGVSFDSVESRVLVACAGGDLVAVSEDGTRVLARTRVAADLRDVGRDARGVWVSQYRSAKLLRLDAELKLSEQQAPAGAVLTVPAPPGAFSVTRKQFTPTLAWRTVAGPGGEPFMLHQRSQSSLVGAENASPVGYYGVPAGNSSGLGGRTFCESGIVQTTISRFGGPQVDILRALPQAVVPVDLSVAPDGRRIAAVAPGNFRRQQIPGALGSVPQQLFLMEAAQLVRPLVTGTELDDSDCIGALPGGQFPFPGEATALQFLDDETLLVQVRSPAALHVLRFEAGEAPKLAKVIGLSTLALHDTGHEVFHQNTGTGIACASCHGEALDDGHVWSFPDPAVSPIASGFGVIAPAPVALPRRTQHLRGGVLQSAPFHWSGDLMNLEALLGMVYTTRMGGSLLDASARDALARWLGSLPLIPSEPGDAARVARGRALFESADVGCATCHAGESLGSNELHDVGSGGAFKVPSLRGIALRLPLMHNGCADTLEKRFDPACGGSDHGKTDQLDAAQLGDLIAYLASL